MKIVRLAALCLALACVSSAAFAQGKPAPKDALLYFVWPQNGTVIKGGFWCRFGLRNMGVTHAGHDFPNSGHHHLLIEARIELPPGKHTLQLVLGDAGHYPFSPPVVSEKITVTIR